MLLWLVAWVVRLTVVGLSLYAAKEIRMLAVHNYGYVIHEFDPWFNYRASQYMVEHGYTAFTNWFDYEVWYPLGRHVGTTVYPGMMITSSAIYYTLQAWGYPMSLNDICVLVPAWFSVTACLFTFLLAWEVYESANAATAATALMSILPAHLMRSVAGGYDNESIAVTAICATFYFWVRSLRSSWSWPIGLVTGLSYVYMVATWGGYVFVLNMIGVHAAALVMLGRHNSTLHRAYTLFYVVGTTGAVQFPIVGWQPLQSMEQLGPLFVFLALQLLEFSHTMKRRRNMSDRDFKEFLYKASAVGVGVLAIIVTFVLPSGFIGPLSARVRGLFVPHTRTGNPLVDSVAEHQATPPEAYARHFALVFYTWLPGFVICFRDKTDAKWFLILYFLCAAYFSRKMTRLLLILAEPAAICAGGTFGLLLDVLEKFLIACMYAEDEDKKNGASKAAKGGKKKKATSGDLTDQLKTLQDAFSQYWQASSTFRNGTVVALSLFTVHLLVNYWHTCWETAGQLSHPQIVLKGQSRTGEPVLIDDFREAYWWLRDNTREDSRVLSWWDYGYQINGVGNRTTLADGNTWNHEHIALLGKVLTSPEKESWEIARHLADYVLVWTTRWGGMSGDDIAKSPHMARIGSSVYEDIDFRNYWYDERRSEVSSMMEKSLLWRLHHYRLDPKVPTLTHYKEVFTSKHNMVRIYKVQNRSRESKEFCARALAWAREHGGGGKYPPALDWLIKQRKDFTRKKEGKYML